MKVGSKHKHYDAMKEDVILCRAAIDGQRAVRGLQTIVLPKPKGYEPEEYKAYIEGGSYFNASGRTLEALLGLVFRKDPEESLPTGFDAVKEDFDMAGNSLTSVARSVLTELMVTPHCGVLVEYPNTTGQTITVAQAQRMNMRPYATMYPFERILNWKYGRLNNVYQLLEVHLYEDVEDNNDVDHQIRQLLIEDGRYIQRVWQKMANGSDYQQVGADIVPAINGKAIEQLPFWAISSFESCLSDTKPPLLDLVNVNLAHFRTSCNYERGCMFTGCPTPVLAGFPDYIDAEGKKEVRIGTMACLITRDPQAKWGFLEFTGAGLSTLERNMEKKEQQMAALGARMLAPEKTGVEAQGTLQMRSNGENSVLAGIASNISNNMMQVIDFMMLWMGINSEKAQYELNRDYLPVGMTAEELKALLLAVQSGHLPKEEFFYNLKRGEVIREKTTFEQYESMIEEDPPATGVMNDGEREDPGSDN